MLTGPLRSDSYVDVHDLTKAILLAITTPAAGGERFVISAGQFRWEDFSE